MGIYEELRLGSFCTLVLVLCLSLGSSACDQQTEGCLDFRALSVTIDADNACADCCSYPTLQLQLLPTRFDANTLQLLQTGDTLSLGPLQGTQVELAYYLHDVFLITDDGERIEMRDTFTVFSDGESPNYLYESSVLRVAPYRQKNYELGTLLEEAVIVAVEAKLGLPDVFADVDYTLQPSSSPLFQDADSLLFSLVDSSYYDLGFRYDKLDGTKNSFQLVDASNQLIRWDLPQPSLYTPSYNLLISLALPADQLLGLDSASLSGAVFVSEFLTNASVVEISLNR